MNSSNNVNFTPKDPLRVLLDCKEAEITLMARQRQIDLSRIAELEAAIDKLAQCKGRFHTEANFKALIEVRNKRLHK